MSELDISADFLKELVSAETQMYRSSEWINKKEIIVTLRFFLN